MIDRCLSGVSACHMAQLSPFPPSLPPSLSPSLPPSSFLPPCSGRISRLLDMLDADPHAFFRNEEVGREGGRRRVGGREGGREGGEKEGSNELLECVWMWSPQLFRHHPSPSLPRFLPSLQVLSLLSRPRGELVIFREETLVEEALGGKMASAGSTGFLRQVGRKGGREEGRCFGKLDFWRKFFFFLHFSIVTLCHLSDVLPPPLSLPPSLLSSLSPALPPATPASHHLSPASRVPPPGQGHGSVAAGGARGRVLAQSLVAEG